MTLSLPMRGITTVAAIMALAFFTLTSIPTADGAIRAVGKHKGDYLPAHNFKLEIDGVISGGFKEISGLESEIEVVEFRNGDDPIVHKRPGAVKYGNIVLKGGFENNPLLLEWYKKVLAGKTDRKSGSVIYLDREGKEVLRYNFFEAWPCKWKLPELTSEGLVEQMEFCVEKVERS